MRLHNGLISLMCAGPGPRIVLSREDDLALRIPDIRSTGQGYRHATEKSYVGCLHGAQLTIRSSQTDYEMYGVLVLVWSDGWIIKYSQGKKSRLSFRISKVGSWASC